MSAACTSLDAPEVSIARDLARRALFISPIFLLIGVAIDGVGGLISSGLALALVAFNFFLGAKIISRAIAISLNTLYGAVLFGYLIRLGLMAVAVLIVRNADWFATVPFAITLLITHLGLLIWETKHVSLSLAFPGVMPAKPSTDNFQE